MKTFVQSKIMFAAALSIGLTGCGDSLTSMPTSDGGSDMGGAATGGGAPNANPGAQGTTESADSAAVDDGESMPVD